MDFSQRLHSFRKKQGFTQQQMADMIGIHVSQLKRYESGFSQPTIDVFKRIALALNMSSDALLFGVSERNLDEQLKLLFEVVCSRSLDFCKWAMFRQQIRKHDT
ncbi:helix-turn-helix domain-containing protein [Collimonas antrihumi]|uniref:helix-turn-helix domain-containing protein n=1 Tax=Collimonas antrihumi TaxID=1940615 RepID=UPI001B8AD710|nr:helix-turn-helix transcriptional regulator [Collimonas antrihumi]